MIMFRRAAVVAASVALAFAAPAIAQNDPTRPGDYVQVSSISVVDGHGLDYANFLATQWKARQEYAKSQGWITGYEVLSNVNRRPGEPDLLLVTRMKTIPDATEQMKRDTAMRAFSKQTDAEMEAASGERAKYRKQMGTQLWQQVLFN